MSLSRLRVHYGFALLLVAALTWGIRLSNCPSDLVHFAAIPLFAAYVLMFRPEILRRVRRYHFVYLAALTAMVAGYMAAFARITPAIRVRWTELPVAVYFLLSVHVVVWLIDRLINMVLSAAFGLRGGAHPAGAVRARTVLRLACLAAVAGPYLLGTFMTHWVKFADNTDPWRESGIRFQQVHFDAADGAGLAGWFIPAPGFSDATIILASGGELTKACFIPHALALRENGYNVLLFDLRGRGGSSGHTRTFGVLEANDVLGGLRYLKRACPRVSRHVFGFGISEGAAGIIAAAGADDRIEAVVVDSAFADAGSSLNRLTAPLPWPVGAYVRRAALVFASAGLGCDLSGSGAAGDIARLSPRPVLILQAGPDNTAGQEQAERLYAVAGEPKMLCKVANASRGEAVLLAPEACLALTVALFRSVLEGRPAFQ